MSLSPAVAVALAALLCSARAAVADDETTLPADAVAARDVVYATRPTGPVRLDVFTPPGAGPFPLVVWIHGGAWKMGDKAAWSHMNFLVGRGYAVANVGYRFSQVAPFPAQLDDVTAALDFLAANAGRFRIDPTRIAVTGESAGGHLAALLGLTRPAANARAIAPAGDATTRPAAASVRVVIDLFGPSDLAAMTPVPDANGRNAIDDLLGGRVADKASLARDASPIAHVSAAAPPFLILHGTADTLVPIAQSESLVTALRAAGGTAEFVAVEGAGHAGPAFWTDAMRGRIFAFLAVHLRNASTRDAAAK